MISVVPRSTEIFASLRPSETLYYFDEPLIFYTEASAMPLLCLKVDNGDAERQFLCVTSSQEVVSRLKNGTLSLRSAFRQPWCWIVKTNADFRVIYASGDQLSNLPDDYFPEPGIGLYHHHGQVVDEFSSIADASGFLTIAFKGGQLGHGTMPFGIFKELVDGVYSSLRKIFTPVIQSISDHKLAEVAIGRLLNVPVHQPRFASLSISIDTPTIDTSAVKNTVSFDKKLISSKFSEAAEGFVASASEIERLASADNLTNQFAYGSSVALEIMAQLAPNADSPFESVEISGEVRQSARRRVTLDLEKGQKIYDAYHQDRRPQSNLSGQIVELNLRSGTFVLKADGGDLNMPREVTCIVGNKVLKAAMPLFSAGARISISGKLETRSRRDRMVINSITMPDGTTLGD